MAADSPAYQPDHYARTDLNGVISKEVNTRPAGGKTSNPSDRSCVTNYIGAPISIGCQTATDSLDPIERNRSVTGRT